MGNISIVISGTLSDSSLELIKSQLNKLQEQVGKITITPQFNSESTETEVSNFVTKIQNQLTKLQLGKDDLFNSDEIKQQVDQINSDLETVGKTGGKSFQDIRTEVDSLKTSIAQATQSQKEYNQYLNELKTGADNEKIVADNADKISSEYEKATQQIKMFQEQMARNVEIASSQTSDSAIIQQLNGVKSKADEITPSMKNYKNEMQNVSSEYKDLKTQIQVANSAELSFGEQIVHDTAKLTLWTAAATLMFAPLRALQQGIQYVTDLDTAITNITMITGQSRQNVQGMIQDYSNLASQLHETTSNITQAAEEFLRAGNSASDTSKLLQASTVMSKISGQTQADTGNELIAIMNSYKLSATDMMSVVDKLTTLDNNYATSTGEIADAMQRSSQSAQAAGVSLDQLASYIATISSTTRMSSETIGTALNSIFSRYQNVAAGKNIDDAGEAINNVDKVLSNIGINIKDQSGNFTQFGTVLDELSGKWSTLTDVQKAQIATAVAGFSWPERIVICA